MIAVEEGFCALPAAGAEVNRQDAEGYTALMLAAMHDSSENLQLLLKAGAAPLSNRRAEKQRRILPWIGKNHTMPTFCAQPQKSVDTAPRRQIHHRQGFTLAPAPFVVRVR